MYISEKDKQLFARVIKEMNMVGPNTVLGAPGTAYHYWTLTGKYSDEIKAYDAIRTSFQQKNIQFDLRNHEHIQLMAIVRSALKTDSDFSNMNRDEQKIALNFFRSSQIRDEQLRSHGDTISKLFGRIPQCGSILSDIMDSLNTQVPELTSRHIYQLHRDLFTESDAEDASSIKMDYSGQVAYLIRHIHHRDIADNAASTSMQNSQGKMNAILAEIAQELGKTPDEIRRLFDQSQQARKAEFIAIMQQQGIMINDIDAMSDEIKMSLEIAAYELKAIRQEMEDRRNNERFAQNLQHSKQVFSDLASIASITNNPKILKMAEIGQCQIKLMENISRMGTEIGSMLARNGVLSQITSTLGQVSPYVGTIAAVVEMVGIMKRKATVDPAAEMMKVMLDHIREYFVHMEQYLDYVSRDIKEAMTENRQIIEHCIAFMSNEHNQERHFLFEQMMRSSNKQFDRVMDMLTDIDAGNDVKMTIDQINRFANNEVTNIDLQAHSEHIRRFETMYGTDKPITPQYNGTNISFHPATLSTTKNDVEKAAKNESLMLGTAIAFMQTMDDTRMIANGIPNSSIPNMDLWCAVMHAAIINRYAELQIGTFTQLPNRIIADDRFMSNMHARSLAVTHAIRQMTDNRSILFESTAKEYQTVMNRIKSMFIQDFYAQLPNQLPMTLLHAISQGYIGFNNELGISHAEFLKSMSRDNGAAFANTTISWQDIAMHLAGIITISIDMRSLTHTNAACGPMTFVKKENRHNYYGYPYHPAQATFEISLNYTQNDQNFCVQRFVVASGNAVEPAGNCARHPEDIEHKNKTRASNENKGGRKIIFTNSTLKSCIPTLQGCVAPPNHTQTMEDQLIAYMEGIGFATPGTAQAAVLASYQAAVSRITTQDNLYGNDKTSIAIIHNMVKIFSTIIGLDANTMPSVLGLFSDQPIDAISETAFTIWGNAAFPTNIKHAAEDWQNLHSRLGDQANSIMNTISHARSDIQMFHRVRQAAQQAEGMARSIQTMKQRASDAYLMCATYPMNNASLFQQMSSQINRILIEYNHMAGLINQQANIVHQTFNSIPMNPVRLIDFDYQMQAEASSSSRLSNWIDSQKEIMDIDIPEFISQIKKMQEHMRNQLINPHNTFAIILGQSQIGKSTFCNAMSGTKFFRSGRKIDSNDNPRGIGNGRKSETSFIDIFQIDDNHTIIDTPGFDGSRANAIEIAGQISTIMTTRHVNAYHKIVFMITCNDLLDGLKTRFTEDFKKIASIYRNPQDFKDNVMIVINKAPGDIQLADIIEEINTWRTDCHDNKRVNTHVLACMDAIDDSMISLFDPTNEENINNHRAKLFSNQPRPISTANMNMETFHGDVKRVKACLNMFNSYLETIKQSIQDGIAKSLAYWKSNPISINVPNSIVVGTIDGIAQACYDMENFVASTQSRLLDANVQIQAGLPSTGHDASHDATGEVKRDIQDYQEIHSLLGDILALGNLFTTQATHTSPLRRNSVFEDQANRATSSAAPSTEAKPGK